ncbi:MAG: hypothetical protein J5746_04955, partial [Victivallales bacterium]|nr:hypothetical protein [Victivallales bacterium]
MENDSQHFAALEETRKQLEAGLIQGCVFTENRSGKITALGRQRIHPTAKDMTVASRFDMASVGKVFT